MSLKIDPFKAVVFVIILIIAIICSFFASRNLAQSIEQRNKFCQDQGYKLFTDINMRIDSDIIQIECDHEKIFLAAYERKCAKRNKWNECTNHIITYKRFVK